jgi:hypothetical protein
MGNIGKVTEKAKNLAAGYIDKVKKMQAGPAPDLNPKNILRELEKNNIIKSDDFKNGKISICSDNFNAGIQGQDKAVVIIQRGLIALGLMKVDMTKKYWWRKPLVFDDIEGGISWGRYGPRTEEAVNKLQDIGGIDPEKGHKGSLFGRDTLKIFETALEAKAKKMDWISAVKKAAIK